MIMAKLFELLSICCQAVLSALDTMVVCDIAVAVDISV